MAEQQENISPFSILKSALSAMIGVQSNANRQRDFNSGKFWHFFIAGGIVTILFLAVVWISVKLLMASI